MSGSLGKIAKGASIALAGMLVYIFLEFITRVIIARYATPGEYGAFSIGFSLLNIFVMLSCLGLHGGATRCIAYYRGKGDNKKVAEIVFYTLQLSIGAGLLFFLIMFFSTDFLNSIFSLEQKEILKLFAIAIPFLTITEILSYIFIGFDRIKVKVYFRDILLYVIRVLSIVFVVVSGFGFGGMMYAYLLPTVVIAITFAAYSTRKLSIRLIENGLIRKKLFRFSVPLLVTSISLLMMQRTDTLMLGYFESSDVVGLYNSAYPVAQLIPIFLFSIIVVYVPISSQLYSRNSIEEMRRNYSVLTKWNVAATLPFFLVIFLFPEAVLGTVFGNSYVQAGGALQILATGGFVQAFLGPNAATLVVIGKTKLNMIDDLAGALTNVTLNLLLIPVYGIIGAAIASSVSFSLVAAIKSLQIFRIHHLHPFTGNFLKPAIFSFVTAYIIYLIASKTQTGWILILFFVLFIVLYGTGLIITKSLDQEDILMIREIEKLTGLDASIVKRLLRKFI